MVEEKVLGKCYRILANEINDVWHRISFWTHSSDVEFEDGKTAEEKLNKYTINKDVIDIGEFINMEKDENTIYFVYEINNVSM